MTPPCPDDTVTDAAGDRKETAQPLMSASRMHKPELDALQALRGVAAVLVFLHHLTRELLVTQNIGASSSFLRASYPILMGGVHLFFVLTGFFLVYSTRNARSTGTDSMGFVYRRVMRIGPVYWLFTAFFIAVGFVVPSSVANGSGDISEIVSSILFLPYAGSEGNFHPAYGVGWTINYDIFCYAIFAPLLLLRRNLSGIAFVAACCLLVALGIFLTPKSGPLWFWTRPILLEIAGGAAIGILYVRGVRPLKPWLGYVGAIVALLWWVVGVPAPTWDGVNLVGLAQSQSSYLPRGGPAVLMLASLTLTRPTLGKGRGWLRETFGGKALLSIGTVSYSLSMSHLFTLRGLSILVGSIPILAGEAYVYILLALPAVGIGTAAVYLFVEKPLRLRSLPNDRRDI